MGVWIETSPSGSGITEQSESHPSWVCGLKLWEWHLVIIAHSVTPFVGVWIETWYGSKEYTARWVTPFVGVWIETVPRGITLTSIGVTPFVGVWIETHWSMETNIPLESHPSWVCGLKLKMEHDVRIHRSHTLRGCVDWNSRKKDIWRNTIVTPFVGVWIETLQLCKHRILIKSHPSWVCGLKLKSFVETRKQKGSHPSWVCGLKPRRYDWG